MKTFGAVDTPSLDFVIPRWEVIEESLQGFNSEISKAKNIYSKILNEIGNKNQGEKFTLDINKAIECENLALELEKIIYNFGLKIRCAGGTGYNKLYYTKSILGNNIITKLCGAVGQDANGQLLKNKLISDEIHLIDNNKYLPHTRKTLLITPFGATDRIGAKLPYTEPAHFHDIELLKSFIASCDYFYLESSLVKFIGAKNFIKIVEIVSDEKTKIIYSPPTDRSFFLDSNQKIIIENFAAFKKAAEKSTLITMNELEAIWFSIDPYFEGKVEGRKDVLLIKAINFIKSSLKNHPEKMVLITAGASGMIGLTENLKIEVEAISPQKIINTVGAGDSSAATFASIVFRYESLNLTQTLIESALKTATKVASEVISHQDAQISQDLIYKCL